MISLTSKAQSSLGFEAGVSSNFLKINVTDRASTAIEPKVGYYAGIKYQYHLYRWLYINTVPGIIQKKYSIARTDSLSGIFEKKTNIYFQLPIMAHAVFGKKTQYFLEAGFYTSYWASGFVQGKIPAIFSINTDKNQSQTFELSSYQEKHTFNSMIDNRIELGGVGGIGFQYLVLKSYKIYIFSRYFQSMTDQEKKYMINHIPRYNQTLSFSLGLQF